jgi:nitronate monooxygenase
MQGVSWHEPAAMIAEIAAIRRRTIRPFAVNLALQWDQHARLARCIDAGAPVVSLFWGDPTAYFPKLRTAKVKTIVTVGSADEAKRAADLGADAVCAQGVEAGGHVWSKVGTMVLLPAVIDAVAPLPVIAAGGIADGRGLAAVLALGGAGAWIGTRFLATPEAYAHDEWKRRIVAARETDTVYTELFDLDWPNAPHRVLRNSTYDRWDAAGRAPPGRRPGEGEVVARQADGTALLRYSHNGPAPGARGEIEATCLYAGQSAGLVHDIVPAGALVARIVAEAEAALARAGAMRRT